MRQRWLVLSLFFVSCGNVDGEFSAGDNQSGDVYSGEEFGVTTCECAPPLPPTAFWGYASASTSSTFKWTNGSGQTTKKLQLKSASGSFSDVATLTASSTSIVRTGQSGTKTYRIKVGNSCNAAVYSNEASVTMGNPSTPSEPYMFFAGSGKATLRFKKNGNNVQSFEVYGRLSTTTTWTLWATLNGRTTEYTKSGLSSGKTYYMRTRASNFFGKSAYTTQKSLAIPSSSAPAMATGIEATSIGGGTIGLSWTDNATNETNYQIMRAEYPYGPFTTVQTLEAGAESTNVTGHTSGKTYYFFVVAKGSSLSSGRASYIVNYKAPANAPLQLAASEVGGYGATVGWTDTKNSNENGYEVQISSDGTTFEEVGSAERNESSVMIDTLLPDTTYYWRVRATNGIGNGPWSYVSCFTTEPAPMQPTDFDVDTLSMSSIKFTWTDATTAEDDTNESSYDLEGYMSDDPNAAPTNEDFAVKVSGITADTNEYYLNTNEMLIDMWYWARLCASNEAGRICSAPARFYFGSATALNLSAEVSEDGTVTLSWTDMADGESYFDIYQSGNGETWGSYCEYITGSPGNEQEVEHELGTSPHYAVCSLMPGTHYFRIGTYSGSFGSYYSGQTGNSYGNHYSNVVQVVIPCPGGGVMFNGGCWYSGNMGESCDTVCSGVGRTCNISDTKYYVGSDGTNENCGAVLEALGLTFFGGGPAIPTEGPSGIGCAMTIAGSTRVTSPMTECSASETISMRACSCSATGPMP